MAGAPATARCAGAGDGGRVAMTRWLHRTTRRCLGRDSMYPHAEGAVWVPCRIKRQRWLSQKCEQQQNAGYSARIQNPEDLPLRKGKAKGGAATTTIGDTGDCFFDAFCCVALAEISRATHNQNKGHNIYAIKSKYH